MHEARPRSLVSLCRCLRSGPISSVERSARPCPRPSAKARVILGWRHAPSTRCRSMRRRRGRFAGGACGVELSRRTTLNSLRRRASKFSLVCLHGRVKPPRPCQAVNGDPLRFRLSVRCKEKSVYRPEQHGAGVSVTVPGNDGVGPGYGQDDSGGQVRVPAGPAEGSGSFGARPRPRSRPAAASAPCPSDSIPAPTDRAGPIGRGLEALIAPARLLEYANDLRQH